MAQYVAASARADLGAIDRHPTADTGEVEIPPGRARRAQDAARIEEVVGDQGRYVERPVILVAVVDHLDRRHTRAHGGADRMAIVGRARRRQILRQAHRDLAFDPDMQEIRVAELRLQVLHARSEHAAGTRVGDPQEALHHRRGTADLVTGERAVAGGGKRGV